ncbi:MAG TPA: glycosyltransferase [Actinomycetota bacterium]|nr:glycosyltransferase [Actinomycetota bacterium]
MNRRRAQRRRTAARRIERAPARSSSGPRAAVLERAPRALRPDAPPARETAPVRVEPPSPWRNRRTTRALVLANLMAASFYVAWWFMPGHVGTAPLFALLALAEAFNLMHLLGFWWATWATRFDPPVPVSTPFTVDVFITTYGEAVDVVERTVRAAVAMDGPHKTFLLDDACRPEMRRMAVAAGAHYVERRSSKGAKAGNINHALALTNGQLAVIFDADHVPRRDFLTHVLGYFEEDDVAFVQTPQFYGNARDNEIARGAFQQQAIFYGPICRGKEGLGAAFCCGTNVVFRRAALDEVGGFDENTVVEDFVTSMHLHRKGWRSIYYPYVLAEGLGPTNLKSYFVQQFRWARGSVGALLTGEPFKRGFTPTQRFQYFLATTFYLTGLITPIYVLLPILYLLGGWSAFSADSGSFVFFYAPYLMLGLATIKRGLGGQLKLEHLRYTFGTFPVYALASVFALLHVPARFRVTGRDDARGPRAPALAYVVLAAFGATIAAICIGVFLQPIDPRTVINISWATLNLVLMYGIVRMCIREIAAHRFERTVRRIAKPIPITAARHHPLAAGDVVLSRDNPPLLPEWSLPPVASAPKETRSKLFERPGRVVAAATAFGAALRLGLVEAQSLRLDESLSLKQANFDLVEMWLYQVQSNVHVPLYHTILHYWLKAFGSSELALRMPSVIFGIACIPVMYAVSRRVVGRKAAVVATALAAASPFWTWHSNEARMYPLLLFVTLSSMALFFRALERGGALRWLAYALVTGISFYAHYFAMLMPAVHLAYLVINRVPRRKAAAWLASSALAALMFVPWIWALYTLRIEQTGVASLTSGIRPPPPDFSAFGLAYTLLIFLIVFAGGYFGAAALEIMSGIVVGIWPLAALGATIGHAFGWLRSRQAKFMGAWVLLTIGVVFVVNIFKPGLFFQKYLIAASPPLYMALGLALNRVFRRRVTVAVVCAVVLMTAVAVAGNFDRNNPVREDFRTAATIVERRIEPGDAVLTLPKFNETPLQYYLDMDVAGLLSPEQPPNVLIAYVIPELAEQTAGNSLWVVTLYEKTFDARGGVELYLERTFERTERYRIGSGLELRRYEVPGDYVSPTGEAG